MGVDIWEGNKAQALIDAILNTQKIDKQQGSSNAGKGLIVGDDGLIVLGDVGIPDIVKSALLGCFRNVAWKTDDGVAYYNALVEALGYNPPVVPTPIYELGSPVTFDGTNYIDTQVKFEAGKVYTILIEYSPTTINDTMTIVFYHGTSAQSNYMGIQLANHWSTHNKVVWGMGLSQPNDAGLKNIDIGTTARHAIIVDCTGSYFIFTHKYRNLTTASWGNDYYTPMTSFYTSTLQNFETIKLGHSEQSRFANFTGTISATQIYDIELSDEMINDFLTNENT